MTRNLPKHLKKELRKQFDSALKDAMERHPRAVGKEDSITENLGGALERNVRGKHKDYEWRTRSTVLPTQHKDGRDDEPVVGADMVVEIEVEDRAGNSKYKALLIQGKRPQDGRNKALRDQCKKMGKYGKHIVVEYGPEEYTAIPASDVSPKTGTVAKAKGKGNSKPLCDALGKDFLNCTLGRRNMTYKDGQLMFLERGALVSKPFTTHVSVVTTIRHVSGS